MKHISKILPAFSTLILGLLVVSCSYDFPPAGDEIAPLEPGQADFTRIVVLGGTEASGFMDGALHNAGQANSFPALLVGQINSASGDPFGFVQPDINSEDGFNPEASIGDPRGRYMVEFADPIQPSLLFKRSVAGEALTDYQGSVPQNLSIPGIRLADVLSTDLNDNPYYARLSANLNEPTLLDEAIAAQPTLIILALGTQDILSFAANGLIGNRNPVPPSIDDIDLTPRDFFRDTYEDIINRLISETQADILVVNILDFSGFPFFTQLGHLAPITAGEVGAVGGFYAGYNNAVRVYNTSGQGLRPDLDFFGDDPPSLWAVVVEDDSLDDVMQPDGSMLPKWRQMAPGESLLWSVRELPNASGSGFGTFLPIDKQFYFRAGDEEEVSSIINEYNQVISDIANTSNRIFYFDAQRTINATFEDDFRFNGALLTPDLRRTGIFSADGITLNRRGKALLTNDLINFINTEFDANIPTLNINDFPGNEFVNGF
ncbi:MAG: hypothetical protein AAFX87_06800 [Bacteroidota bacterium]